MSDLHFGHRTIRPVTMAHEYRKMILELDDPSGIDALQICGDFFDSGLSLADSDVPVIQTFIIWLLAFCFKHDIQLIILEGTPSHDRGQSKQFNTLNESRPETHRVDIIYKTELCIEYNEKLGLNVLYVPDEIRPTCTQTFLDIVALMKEKDLKKVDLALMHGNFKYQIPAIQHLDSHIERNYLDIVKYFIFVGHVHTMSKFKRILSHGSTTRLKHGEESDKGFLDVIIDFDNGRHSVTFIKNKLATIFKTLDLKALKPEQVLEKVTEYLATGVPDGSHIKLKTSKDVVIAKMFKELKNNHSHLNWMHEKVKDEEIVDAPVIEKIVGLAINKNTIVEQMRDKMIANGVSEKAIAASIKLFISVSNVEGAHNGI